MGEIMLRLMTPDFLRIEQTDSFNAIYDGDEAIVATSLARFGMDVSYVTKLPDNPLGTACLKRIRAENVGTSFIASGPGRLGINFYETGVGLRPPRVIYDRDHSAFANASPDDFDFDAIFTDCSWFHFSGITPAISERTARLTEIAIKAARSHGVTISCDLNYRRKLWSPEKAQQLMKPLMEYVDVCIGNEEDSELVLGLKPRNTDHLKGQIDSEAYRDIFLQMRELYDFKFIGCTLRESYSASDNGWSVLCYDGQEFCQSPHYNIRLVDRGGGGASFAAGFIYGLLNRFPLQQVANFAGAASALKHTIYGGFNLVTLAEVMELAGGDASGRVQR